MCTQRFTKWLRFRNHTYVSLSWLPSLVFCYFIYILLHYLVILRRIIVSRNLLQVIEFCCSKTAPITSWYSPGGAHLQLRVDPNTFLKDYKCFIFFAYIIYISLSVSLKLTTKWDTYFRLTVKSKYSVM